MSEPMSKERLAFLRSRLNDDRMHWHPHHAEELLAEVDRLRLLM